MICPDCSGSRVVTRPEGPGTFMGKPFNIPAMQVPCPACSVVTATGSRTDCSTYQTKAVKLEFSVQIRSMKRVLQITAGGVTGHEGFHLDGDGSSTVEGSLDASLEGGWYASAGSAKFDTLFIDSATMKTVADKLGLIPKVG